VSYALQLKVNLNENCLYLLLVVLQSSTTVRAKENKMIYQKQPEKSSP